MNRSDNSGYNPNGGLNSFNNSNGGYYPNNNVNPSLNNSQNIHLSSFFNDNQSMNAGRFNNYGNYHPMNNNVNPNDSINSGYNPNSGYYPNNNVNPSLNNSQNIHLSSFFNDNQSMNAGRFNNNTEEERECISLLDALTNRNRPLTEEYRTKLLTYYRLSNDSLETLLRVLTTLKRMLSMRDIATLVNDIKNPPHPIMNMIAQAKKLGILPSIINMQIHKGIPNVQKLEELIKLCDRKKINFSSITNMQAHKGIPDLQKLEELLELCDRKKINFSSIANMQASKGIPDLQKLEELLELLSNRQKSDLSSIASMQASKGIPDLQKLEELLELCDRKQVALSSITNMQARQGMPDLQKLEKLLELLSNRQKSDLSSITNMQASKGIPDLQKLEKLLELCDRKKVALSSITGMQARQGMPDLQKLEELLELCKSKKIALSSITGMQYSKGMPDLQKLKYCLESNFFKDCLRQGLLNGFVQQFNKDKFKNKEPINIILFIIMHVEAVVNNNTSDPTLLSRNMEWLCYKSQPLIDQIRSMISGSQAIEDSLRLEPLSVAQNSVLSKQDHQSQFDGPSEISGNDDGRSVISEEGLSVIFNMMNWTDNDNQVFVVTDNNATKNKNEKLLRKKGNQPIINLPSSPEKEQGLYPFGGNNSSFNSKRQNPFKEWDLSSSEHEELNFDNIDNNSINSKKGEENFPNIDFYKGEQNRNWPNIRLSLEPEEEQGLYPFGGNNSSFNSKRQNLFKESDFGHKEIKNSTNNALDSNVLFGYKQ